MELFTLLTICFSLAIFFMVCMHICAAANWEKGMLTSGELAVSSMLFILIVVVPSTYPTNKESKSTEVKVVNIGDQQVINFKNQIGEVQYINLTERYQRVFGPTVKVTEYDRNFWFIKRSLPVAVTNP
jgi:hypothetical protein